MLSSTKLYRAAQKKPVANCEQKLHLKVKSRQFFLVNKKTHSEVQTLMGKGFFLTNFSLTEPNKKGLDPKRSLVLLN
jgi:hypothetical protein